MDSATNPRPLPFHAEHDKKMFCCSFSHRILQLPLLLGFTPLLGLKSGHACDVTSVVAEFMVDAARVAARPCV
jgi:hypothetical protein